MAKIAHSRSTSQKPTGDAPTACELLENSLDEIVTIADIIIGLSVVMISTENPVGGTSFEWLGKQLIERQEAILALYRFGSFGAGA